MAIEIETNIDLENIDIQLNISTAPKLNAAKSNLGEIHNLSKRINMINIKLISSSNRL